MRSTTNRKYWFPAKRSGWGWGPPDTWQGWTVLIAYLVLALGGIPFVQVTRGNVVYVVYLAVLTVLLTAICWSKGEPSRRLRGDRDG
jgi:hypothetical protein